MEKNQKRKAFVIRELRKASYKWPPRSECLKRARVARGLYKCAKCGGTFKREFVHLDHIDPVIDPEQGFIDYNTYIPRLFCDLENWQIICIQCHNDKTNLEDARRKKSS